jgi:hypothetical protein
MPSSTEFLPDLLEAAVSVYAGAEELPIPLGSMTVDIDSEHIPGLPPEISIGVTEDIINENGELVARTASIGLHPETAEVISPITIINAPYEPEKRILTRNELVLIKNWQAYSAKEIIPGKDSDIEEMLFCLRALAAETQ